MTSPLDLFDASPEALLLVEDEKIAWVSGGAARMLGASPHDLVRRSIAEVLGDGEFERLRLFESQRREGWQIPADYRVRFRRLSDGREVATELRVSIVPDGPRATAIFSARDVTSVTRAERLMGELAQLSASGTAVLDANALLDASETLFGALGWLVAFTQIFENGSVTLRMIAEVGDPVGDYGRSVVGVHLPFERTPILTEVVRTGKPVFLDNLPTLLGGPRRDAVELARSMAQARIIRSAWCPVLTNGRLTHVLVVTGKDLTEHDFVAVQLFAAQLGAANRVSELRAELVHRERLAAVGEMAAVLAHEVRNPLGVMFNAIAELRRPGGPSGDGAQLLSILQEEAERLQRLVGDLLDFSRPTAPEVQLVNVASVVEQAIESARRDPACERAGTGLRMNVDVNPTVTARTDPHLFRQALVNLLVNAYQSAPPDSAIDVAVADEGAGELRLTIRNAGPPITAAEATHIFEPFYTTKATGTGLGLAVVRRLLGDLGGRVALDASDEGVSFSLWLPSEGLHHE